MEVSAHNEKHALFFGLTAVLLWSTVATGFKLGLTVLAVEQLLLLGTVVSWLIFFFYALFTKNFRLPRQDWCLMLLLGFINPFAYYLILFAAYDRLPAHIAQPLNYTWAITLALLAVPILKQPLTRKILAGLLISYCGVVFLLVTGERSTAAGWDYTGITLALTSTVLWALYWLLNTRSTSPPTALLLWSFSFGLVWVTLACWTGPGLPELTVEHLGYGLWVGALEMGVTFLVWQKALKLTNNAARIGQLIFLSPFISLLLIQVVLGEAVSVWTFGALGLIVMGLQVARRAQLT
jgi:drug/metabolite transporter (DMT)-like permease